MRLLRAPLDLMRARETAHGALGSALLSAVLSACSGSPFIAADQAVAGSGGASGNADAATAPHAGSPAGVAGGASADGGSRSPDKGGTHRAGDGADPGSGGSAGDSASGAGSAQGGALGSSGAPADGSGGANGQAPCNRGAGTDYQLRLYSETQHLIEQEVHPFFNVSSLTGKSVELKRLKIRYYYTKEAEGAEVGSCFWVTGDRCSVVKFEFSDVIPPTTTANRVMQLSFSSSGASSATVGLTDLEVRTGFTVNHANLEQNNDYSFDSNAHGVGVTGALPYAPWDHVTLYVDDRLVWGTEPCPASDTAQSQ